MTDPSHDFSFHSGGCVECGVMSGSPASERPCEPSIEPTPIHDGGAWTQVGFSIGTKDGDANV